MKSANQIRSRLLLMLGRAFLSVLLFLILLFPIITAFVLTNYSEKASLRFPLVSSLEGFYRGRGSWDGVESVFQRFDSFPPEFTLLLDADNRIILDGGQASVSTVGSRFEFDSTDIKFQLYAGDQKIGALIIKSLPLEWRRQAASGILFSVAGISFALGLFVVAIAFLLMRRFVNPLADVIYAAHEVANGKLDTRIPLEGPQDLHSLAESFNEMASSLERNDRERRDLLADIAHELRTPLSVIRGRLEGIVDGIYSADGEQVSLALNQTYLLERLVDDLRLLTLAESRQLHFEKKTVDLTRLISHSIEMFSAEAREKNISFSFEKGSGDFALELDAQRTEQAIGNLIGNALRHTPAGSKVWLTLDANPDSVCISVNDNGPGVPNEDLSFLFDRFWRKDKSRTRSSGGTGLGLAIAKQLVEAQGGTISAQNLMDGGLQVQIIFKTK